MSDQQKSLKQIMDFRIEKLESLKNNGINPYPPKFEPTHFSNEIILDYQIKDCQYLNKMGMEIYIWKHLLKLRLIYQINKKNY